MKPLKILHVANRAEKKYGKLFYSFPYKINNGLVRNGHNVIWFSDRDISRALAPIKSQKLGKSACNKALIEFCRNFRPDIILFGHADIITAETIDRIRSEQGQIRVGQYNIDALFVPSNIKNIHSKADVVDMTFVTTDGNVLSRVAKGRSSAAFVPNPVDSSIEVHKNFESDRLPVDVFFAGQISHLSASDDLRNSLTRLPNDLPEMKIAIHHSIWGDDHQQALGQAKIGLSLSTVPAVISELDKETFFLYSSDRISQYMGNGMLTITDRIFEMQKLYGEGTLIEVRDYKELIEKILYFMQNTTSACNIAREGWRVAHQYFNEKLVVRYMVDALTGGSCSGGYKWSTKIWK
jgi:hypothetical protein